MVKRSERHTSNCIDIDSTGTCKIAQIDIGYIISRDLNVKVFRTPGLKNP